MSQLFYYTPSGGDWNKALPIGNGKLGAMIFGEEHEEHFQLNEDSVWFGTKRNRNNADARKNLEKIRELILNGKISERSRRYWWSLRGHRQRYPEPVHPARWSFPGLSMSDPWRGCSSCGTGIPPYNRPLPSR